MFTTSTINKKNKKQIYTSLIKNNLNIGDRSLNFVHDSNFELLLGLRKKNIIFNPNYQIKTMNHLFQYIRDLKKYNLKILIFDFNILLEEGIDLSKNNMLVLQEWESGDLSNNSELGGVFSPVFGKPGILDSVGLIINITDGVSETILNEFKPYNIPVANLSDGKWVVGDSVYTLLFPLYTWSINFFFDVLVKQSIFNKDTHTQAPLNIIKFLPNGLKKFKLQNAIKFLIKSNHYFKQVKQFKELKSKNLKSLRIRKKYLNKFLILLSKKNVFNKYNRTEYINFSLYENNFNQKYYLPLKSKVCFQNNLTKLKHFQFLKKKSRIYKKNKKFLYKRQKIRYIVFLKTLYYYFWLKNWKCLNFKKYKTKKRKNILH